MIHHVDETFGDGACCGLPLATIDQITTQWGPVECLLCVAKHHPIGDQRRRAWVKLAPDRRDLRAVEEWLGL